MSESKQYIWSIQDYFKAIQRRSLWLLLPAVTIFSMAVILAFVLPATYQSKATIMIEEQAIPLDFVRSTITSFAAQQVQIISQKVLTIENINGIIDKFEMYKRGDAVSQEPNVQLALKFRNNVNLEMISADVIDPRSGRPTEATIAFSLAFNDPDPALAKRVASELVTLFLDENKRERTAQASSTAEFLADQADKLNTELRSLEQRLADFKSENEGSLPEQYRYNLDTLERSRREMSDVRLRLQELAKRKIETSARMSQLSPTAPVVLATGEMVMSDADRLKALQTEYRRKAAIYRDNHPDVIRLGREIEALQAQLGVETDIEDLRRQLQEQEQHLADLTSRYNDNHHEVVSTRRVIQQLQESIRKAPQQSGTGSAPVADNPAYVVLQTELYTMEADSRALAARESELAEQIAQYENVLSRAPQVEKEYQALLRDYDNATAEYRQIKANQREAITSRNLEQEQKGQRFVVVEPPRLPPNPVSPNRPAIIFLGFVLAIGVGIGAVVVREAMDGAIHGAGQLAALLGEAPLVAIPYIKNREDVIAKWRTWICSAGLIACCLVAFYYLQMAILDL